MTGSAWCKQLHCRLARCGFRREEQPKNSDSTGEPGTRVGGRCEVEKGFLLRCERLEHIQILAERKQGDLHLLYAYDGLATIVSVLCVVTLFIFKQAH